ncbi:MAG: hypothetical protein ABF243_05475 [Celeribacter marinus]
MVLLFRRMCLAFGVLTLCACQMTLPTLSALTHPKSAPSVTFAHSGIVLRGPDGYCVDTPSLRDEATTGFALMANCDALKGRTLSADDAPLAVLTASISAPASSPAVADPDVLAAFFATDSGRAALARSGQSSDVTLIDSYARGYAYYIHALDRSPNPMGAFSHEYWRAVALIKGRIVTLTVMPFTAYPLSGAQMKRQITYFTEDVLQANLDDRSVIVSE